MNAQELARSITLAIPQGRWSDAITGEQMGISEEESTFHLPPFGYKLLKLSARKYADMLEDRNGIIKFFKSEKVFQNFTIRINHL
ncbi:hypothetical protein D3C73_1560880 [compost metagenome]